jgi:hypothetical protein
MIAACPPRPHARCGHLGYRWFARHLGAAPDGRAWLRHFYAPSRWKSLAAPFATRLLPRATAVRLVAETAAPTLEQAL